MNYPPAYHYLLDYQLIPSNDYRARIRYFDTHRSHFDDLQIGDRLTIHLDYSKAIFEVANYYRYLELVDDLIEQVIMHNVYEHQGEKIYEALLFRKAAALHNIGKYDQSISLIQSILHIDDRYPMARRLLALCIRKRGKHWYKLMKAIAIVFLFSAVSIMIAELFVVRTFYTEYMSQISMLRIVLLSISVILLVLREVAMIWTILRESRP